MARQITLTLDDDVMDRIERAAERSHKPLDEVANEMLRKAPEAVEPQIVPQPFVVRARDMGARPGVDFTCVWKLLDDVEGPTRK